MPNNKIIDVHVHTFNNAYFPIEGILLHYIKRLKGKHRLMEFLKIFFLKKIKSNKKDAIANELEIFISIEEHENLVKHIVNEYNQSDISDQTIQEAYNELTNESKFSSDKIGNWRERLMGAIFKSIPNNIFRWLCYMRYPQSQIIQHLRDIYPGSTYVNHHMDTVPTYEGEAYYSFEDQINEINELTDDSFFNFVGFNPLNPKSFNQVKNAIKNKNFKGVKYYPPLGYNPIDPNFKKQQEKLFRYCNKKSIPIFIHTTKTGFGPYQGCNANPLLWIPILENYPNIRICFGHSGGNEGWFEDQREESTVYKNSFAYHVINICNKYEKAFCEVGFLHYIFDKNENKYLNQFIDNLKYQLKNDSFKKSIMYGSDWHTLMNETIDGIKFDETYQAKFVEILNNFNSEIQDHFFLKNAERYLGIDDTSL